MTAPVIGALILQYPVGRLSDRFDRRMVIFGVAVMGACAAAMATLFGRADFALLLICMLVYGGSLFPLYSLCIAHGNDFLTPSQMVAAASGLVMINGAGAVIGSPLAALSLEYFGVTSFFILVTVIQLMIAGFALFRMTRRAAVPNLAQGPFVAIPESSSAIAATLNPEAEWIPGSDEETEEDDPFHDNPYID
jgi:MFS family permease